MIFVESYRPNRVAVRRFLPKLGIEFVNWGQVGDRYIHGFGTIGQDTWTVDFHQYWLKRYLDGKAKGLEAYSINTMACLKNKFMRPKLDMPKSPLSQIAYAFHFDAALYARYLREFSEARNVKRVEGRITEVHKNPEGSRVTGLTLQSGERVEADYFVGALPPDALVALGCLHQQGHLYSPALPAREFEDFLVARMAEQFLQRFSPPPTWGTEELQ
mgnify:CR=1 FL=1